MSCCCIIGRTPNKALLLLIGFIDGSFVIGREIGKEEIFNSFKLLENMVHESKTDCPVIGVLAQAGVKICVEIVVLNLESEF